MSCDVDELDINPFFRALQSTYLHLYEQAQNKCYLVCVPQASSIEGITITQKFVETHILRPSPYFTGQYLTINPSRSKTVLVDDNGQMLQTGEGFSRGIKIKILGEELSYNKDYKHYKILVVERPLDPRYLAKHSLKDSSTTLSSPKISFQECKAFLKSFPEYEKVLQSLEKNISLFNKNYMMLKDYLQDAANRLEMISLEAGEKCLRCTKMKLHSDPVFRETLSGAVESYVLGNVHQKVFPVICERHRNADRILMQKCRQLNGVVPEQLGVSKEISCPLPTAVVELANLDGLNTPREKLLCIKTTVDNMSEGLNAYVLENQQPQLAGGSADKPCVTSDDLIPVLVTVIAQAKCSHLASDIYYMENFSWFSSAKDMDSVSYCLVTFKAAVQYMETTDFAEFQLQKPVVKQEISIDELVAVTNPLSLDSEFRKSPRRGSPSNALAASQSRMDRQLQKISRMLQESQEEWQENRKKHNGPKSIFGREASVNSVQTLHLETARDRPDLYLPPPDVIPEQDPGRRKNQLGDFLSALQDDDFDQPFGKQA